jgi:hypothetical protein
MNLSDDARSPLPWWKEHARLYPNVAFLAKQILAILGSEIAIERIFSVSRVLISLCRCRLGLTNLDALVMIYKNWPKDAQVGCHFTKKDVGEFFTFEANLFEAHKEELV